VADRNELLAHRLDPDSPDRMTPRPALRSLGLYLSDEDRQPPTAAAGHYLDRERPVE